MGDEVWGMGCEVWLWVMRLWLWGNFLKIVNLSFNR